MSVLFHVNCFCPVKVVWQQNTDTNHKNNDRLMAGAWWVTLKFPDLHTASSDYYIYTCCPFIRPSPLFKIKETKQVFTACRVWVGLGGSLMTPYLVWSPIFWSSFGFPRKVKLHRTCM